MATITSHTLNGLDGSHAGGIAISLRNMSDGLVLAEAKTDPGGRLSLEIPDAQVNTSACYELTFETGAYWAAKGEHSPNIIREIVLRFDMPETAGSYHMPVILSPFSYSTWKSG